MFKLSEKQSNIFVTCDNGKAVCRPCPFPLVFDNYLRTCIFKKKKVVKSKNKTAAGTTASVKTTGTRSERDATAAGTTTTTTKTKKKKKKAGTTKTKADRTNVSDKRNGWAGIVLVKEILSLFRVIMVLQILRIRSGEATTRYWRQWQSEWKGKVQMSI